MSYYELNPEILKSNLEFIREEIKRIDAARQKLAEQLPDAKSDDADTLIRGYSRAIADLRSLIRYNYDADR